MRACMLMCVCMNACVRMCKRVRACTSLFAQSPCHGYWRSWGLAAIHASSQPHDRSWPWPGLSAKSELAQE